MNPTPLPLLILICLFASAQLFGQKVAHYGSWSNCEEIAIPAALPHETAALFDDTHQVSIISFDGGPKGESQGYAQVEISCAR